MTDLARHRAEIIAYYRALDEGPSSRHYFRHLDDEGGLWYFEAVAAEGELIAVKQAHLPPEGSCHRYSWEHLDDAQGGLTDIALSPDADPLVAIAVGEFQRAWTQ